MVLSSLSVVTHGIETAQSGRMNYPAATAESIKCRRHQFPVRGLVVVVVVATSDENYCNFHYYYYYYYCVVVVVGITLS